MAQKDVFLKLNLNILKSYENYAIIILAPDKIDIKSEKLAKYELKIAHLYNILIDNVKKLVPNFFQ